MQYEQSRAPCNIEALVTFMPTFPFFHSQSIMRHPPHQVAARTLEKSGCVYLNYNKFPPSWTGAEVVTYRDLAPIPEHYTEYGPQGNSLGPEHHLVFKLIDNSPGLRDAFIGATATPEARETTLLIEVVLDKQDPSVYEDVLVGSLEFSTFCEFKVHTNVDNGCVIQGVRGMLIGTPGQVLAAYIKAAQARTRAASDRFQAKQTAIQAACARIRAHLEAYRFRVVRLIGAVRAMDEDTDRALKRSKSGQ